MSHVIQHGRRGKVLQSEQWPLAADVAPAEQREHNEKLTFLSKYNYSEIKDITTTTKMTFYTVLL